MTSTARKPFGEFGSANAIGSGEPSRQLPGSSLKPSFKSSGNNWSGGIWASTAIGSGLKGGVDSSRARDEPVTGVMLDTVTGSGSLLPSSESDSTGLRQIPWSAMADTSSGVSSMRSHTSSTSPVRHRNNDILSQPQSYRESSRDGLSHVSASSHATFGQGIGNKTSFLDTTLGNYTTSSTFDSYPQSRSSRHNSNEVTRHPGQSIMVGSEDLAFTTSSERPNLSGSSGYLSYNSNVPSRTGSLPSSRNGAETPVSVDNEYAIQLQQSRYNQSNALTHRANQPSHTSTHSTQMGGQRTNDQPASAQFNDLSNQLGKVNLGKENHEPSFATQNGSYPDLDYQTGSIGQNVTWGNDGNRYHEGQDSYESEVQHNDLIASNYILSNNMRFGNYNAHSTTGMESRRNQDSPLYTNEGPAPPGEHRRGNSSRSTRANVPNGQAALLDRKLRGLQHEQYRFSSSSPNPLQLRGPYAPPYDYSHQQMLRMNPMAQYYPVPPLSAYQPNPMVARGPLVENPSGDNLRSTLLEEFRSNNKGNKRYELKDIYDHVVEFSGDQHGSRFIQQKLETANSDEKNQIFQEILPNSLQLMTDVFGNYVIQKFFEHGNQGQKKILANQMKGHILDLSLQMYGCRVVQKAFEHILTDQQASLVKELENQVMKCVKDQNGNHVIQKAIERIPAEHIQFVINAFTGHVYGLATHPYGCRVIQRMLEHCQEPSRTMLLQELHACASTLIVDQYGNYVTQHVIEHGRAEDRARVVALVIAQLEMLSKHKFASNVVEKSVQFGTDEHRHQMINVMKVVDPNKGETPLPGLIKDQYGNYVIQKLLVQLQGADYIGFVDTIKPQLNHVKRFSYGKQIAAIEKLIFTTPQTPQAQNVRTCLTNPHLDTSAAPTPPLTNGEDAQSPQSSSLPSTNTSTVDGPVGERKVSGPRAVEVNALASP